MRSYGEAAPGRPDHRDAFTAVSAYRIKSGNSRLTTIRTQYSAENPAYPILFSSRSGTRRVLTKVKVKA